MTGTPVRNLATDTFALFGDAADPGRVLHRYSVSRSLLDEATVPVMLDPRPVVFEMDDEALQAEFDQFADDFGLDDPDRETLSRKFGRLTSVFGNPDRVRAVCQNIVDHYLTGAYRNGLKAQVVAFSRELAVTYTDTINELLAGYEASRVLAEVGRHERITAEVNISVSDAKDEDPAMRPYRMTDTQEEEQKRRFLTPDDPLCFLVVTAKLMAGFDAPNEGVLYLDKPMKAHTLFQAITRPNRTWISPAGYTKTTGVVVDYIGLAGEVQRAVTDPTAGEEGDAAAKGGGFVTDLSDLVAEFRATFARVEDLLAGVDDLDLTVHGYASVRAISAFLDSDPAAAEAFARDYRLLARLYPHIGTDPRAAKYRDGFGLFGSVYTTLFKKSSDEERKERLADLGPMVLEIINAHVHSFTVAASQEEPLVLDAQGIAILKELLALVRPKTDPDEEVKAPPSAAEILDAIKVALDEGVEPELTPEQRERLHDQVDRIHDDLLAKIDFKFPQLDLGTSAVARIAEDMAKLSRITLPEGMLKNMAGVSIFAERHSEMLSQIKPVLDAQSALLCTLPVINSDIFKLTGLNQGYFNTIASQLVKSADFGWTGELARITNLYADQQAQWLKAITPALTTLRTAFFPSNLQDIAGLGLQSSSARREILGRKWKEIAADCRAALESCQSSELAPVVRFALDAVDALERGNATSAQALAGSLIDTILRKYLDKTRSLITPGKKTKNAGGYLNFSVRKYIALGPIWQAYQSYYPDKGDHVPRTFNRHATAHTVGSRQYSRRNAVQGLMLVCGSLKFLDEQDLVWSAA